MTAQAATSNLWADFQHEIERELDQAQKSLKEISMMLNQSQAEASKLAQRNATINAHLQQPAAHFENMPRTEIRTTYQAAMEAQQRLFVMRGQVEKLQSDQANLERYIGLLQKVLKFLKESGEQVKPSRAGDSTSVLELVITAQEAERKRLAGQIHDGPAQSLSNLVLQADIAARLLEMDPVRAKQELGNLRSAAKTTLENVRGFITQLRPMMLDDIGLFPTLRRYAEMFREQNSVDMSFELKGQEQKFGNYVDITVYRAVLELVGNAYRFNQDMVGRLQISIIILIEQGTDRNRAMNHVRVTVSDNGRGFDPEQVSRGSGLGLKLIREQVEMLGGTFEIDSAIGRGSKISFQIPFTPTLQTAKN
jgi:two-component system sensor histidine kinase DegS